MESNGVDVVFVSKSGCKSKLLFNTSQTNFSKKPFYFKNNLLVDHNQANQLKRLFFLL